MSLAEDRGTTLGFTPLGRGGAVSAPAPTVALAPLPRSMRLLGSVDEVDQFPLADLSPWFNPFLRDFMHDSLRVGGEVIVTPVEGLPEGLLLVSPMERLGSIFTRSPEVAQSLLGVRPGLEVFSDLRLGPTGEEYRILKAEVGRTQRDHAFRHPVRRLLSTDIPAVTALMREVHGPVDARWFHDRDAAREVGFVVVIGGAVAGAAWASVSDGHGRLHSLAVRPPFRRVGIGSDLLWARLLWLKAVGARDVVCEIAARNQASLATAARGGLAPVGSIYLYDAP